MPDGSQNSTNQFYHESYMSDKHKKYILLYDIEEGFVFPPFCLPSFIYFLPGCRPSFEDKLPEEVCGGEKKHLNTAKTLLCVSDHV